MLLKMPKRPMLENKFDEIEKQIQRECFSPVIPFSIPSDMRPIFPSSKKAPTCVQVLTKEQEKIAIFIRKSNLSNLGLKKDSDFFILKSSEVLSHSFREHMTSIEVYAQEITTSRCRIILISNFDELPNSLYHYNEQSWKAKKELDLYARQYGWKIQGRLIKSPTGSIKQIQIEFTYNHQCRNLTC